MGTSQRRFTHFVVPLAIVGIASGLAGQRRDAVRPSVDVVHDKPRCSGCKWELGPPQPVLSLLRDTSLWFGALPGYALDAHGRVYVADIVQRQILRLDLGEHRALRVGRHGQGPGEFVLPQLVATAASGHIVVYDASLRRVSEFDEAGTFLRGFTLPVPLMNAWSMAIDDAGDVFISGTSTSNPTAAFVVHKFSRAGAWVLSFADAGGEFPDETERLYGDGGPLWWDRATRTLWLSRGGPRLELAQYSREGKLLKRVHLSDDLLRSWRPRMKIGEDGGRVRVSASTRLGSIGLLPLPGNLLLNVAVVDDRRTMRYDAVGLADGELVARWTEESQPGFVGLGDGREWVFRFLPNEASGPIRYPVRFTQQPNR